MYVQLIHIYIKLYPPPSTTSSDNDDNKWQGKRIEGKYSSFRWHCMSQSVVLVYNVQRDFNESSPQHLNISVLLGYPETGTGTVTDCRKQWMKYWAFINNKYHTRWTVAALLIHLRMSFTLFLSLNVYLCNLLDRCTYNLSKVAK